MKRRILILAGALALLPGGCAGGGAPQGVQAGQALLSALFTSNQDGRWDAYQAAAAEGSDLEAAARDYLAPFQPFCTAGGLETLASNRYPTRCDSLAQEYGVALQPGEAEISEPDGSGASAFSLPVDLVSDGQTAGSVTLEGQLVFAEEDGALLVDGLALYNLDDLSAALSGG